MVEKQLEAPALEVASLHEADMRRHHRHLCIDGGFLRLAVRPEFRGRHAVLVDVSAGGIGFLLENALEPGTMLTFELQGAAGTEPMARIARVRHSRPHPAPADAPWLKKTASFSKFFRRLLGQELTLTPSVAWLVGCEFDRPMSDAEIARFLDQLHPPE
jgi:hypothetical protein